MRVRLVDWRRGAGSIEASGCCSEKGMFRLVFLLVLLLGLPVLKFVTLVSLLEQFFVLLIDVVFAPLESVVGW